jgi:peptidoglycan hydrolase-like protein with peptidoglycan-binding domain
MNKAVAVAAVAAVSVSLAMAGCGKKESSELSQDSLSMSALSTLPTDGAPAAGEMKTPEPKPEVAVDAAVTAVQEALPPQGPYKPSGTEIQTALKNAGFYTGTVDGKIGPMTKKAIEEFQKANGLKADGKIGPQSWAILGTYLAEQVASETQKKKR